MADTENNEMADTENNEKSPSKKTKAPKTVVYVLEKNFGYIEAGVHKFIKGGREFIEAEDSALIAKLHRLGASIKQKI